MASHATAPAYKEPKQTVHYAGHGKGVRAKGSVSKIEVHPNGKHATVSVRHGAPSKSDSKYADSMDSETHSSVMSASDARKFKPGQKVHVAIMPDDDGDEAPAKKSPAKKVNARLAAKRAAVGSAIKKAH